MKYNTYEDYLLSEKWRQVKEDFNNLVLWI
jgi:hypothetical protein